MRTGLKHTVTCQCIIPQLRNDDDAPLHQFVVFSQLEDDNIIPRVVQCNNCGVLHRVVELCRSEVLLGKESSRAVPTIDDVKASLQPNIVAVLEAHEVDLPTWENVGFIVEQQRWGDGVVLVSEDGGDVRHGKFMRVLGENLCKVETFTRDEVTR